MEKTYDEIIQYFIEKNLKPQDNLDLIHFVVRNYKLREDYTMEQIVEDWQTKRSALEDK